MSKKICFKHSVHVSIGLVSVLLFVLSGCSTSRQLRKADKRYEAGEYYAAVQRYRKVQPKISYKKQRQLKSEVNFKMGECYRQLSNHRNAQRAYAGAIRYKYNDSTVYLNYAKSLYANGNYKDAAANYAIYLTWRPRSKEALAGLRSVEEVASWKKINTRYRMREATEFKSRRNSDFSPMFVGNDGQMLIFTSNRELENNRKVSPITGVAANNLFVVKKNNSGKWEKPTALEGEVNSSEDEGIACFSADGKTIYFTRAQENFVAAQIYKSSRSGGEWNEPQLLTLFPDSSITVAHPALSPDGSRLYFVSDAPGGYGGKDIWFVDQMGSGWSVAMNAGPEINTSGDEMFPCLRTDSVLYFSSNGHPGFGGLDLFKAVMDSSRVWKVQNLLMPLNSSGDDFGITFEGNLEQGYLSSNREQKRGIDRLFFFELPPLVYAIEGVVRDDRGELVNSAIIRLVGNNGDNVKVRTKKDGSYRIVLNRGANYVMMASSRGFLNQSSKLSTYQLDDSKTFEQNFMLSSITKPVTMDNIFYEFGKWTLTQESEQGLNALVKLLNDNPNITIEIAAHTDMIGGEESNQELSQKRAQSVVNYLIKSGIERERLTPKGYGETQPVQADKNIHKLHKFIKEGQILSPDYIEQLSAEQQEICNQINRRTEFKVLKTTYNLY